MEEVTLRFQYLLLWHLRLLSLEEASLCLLRLSEASQNSRLINSNSKSGLSPKRRLPLALAA